MANAIDLEAEFLTEISKKYEIHAFRTDQSANAYNGKGSKWANHYAYADDLETAHRIAQDLLLTYDTVSIS